MLCFRDKIFIVFGQEPLPSVAPVARYAASRMNGSRGLGRQLTRYEAPSIVLTALLGAHGTQHAVDLGSVLIGRRATRCSLSASLCLPKVAGDRRDDAEGGHSGSGGDGVARLGEDLNKCRACEVAAADCLYEDIAVLRLRGAHRPTYVPDRPHIGD